MSCREALGKTLLAGLASALGLALGGVVLVLTAALGLTAIVTNSKLLYLTIQYLGTGYLIYLGVQMYIPARVDDSIDKVSHESFSQIVLQGVMVEILNPKTILFFLAFLPQFIDGESGDVSMQMLVLGMLVPLTALPSDIVVSFAGGMLTRHLANNQNITRALSWLGGAFLVGLGIRTFFL